MHDKQIRRRRAVLALLVAISLILLTDYFGESPTSPLHSIQLGVADVLSPVQNGASKVFSPVRDVAGWISSTAHAKSQVAQLTHDNQNLTKQLAYDQYDKSEYVADQRLLRLDNVDNLKQYGPVAANVIGKNPSLWYQTVRVDTGTGSGVKVNDPVIGGGGLVGEVSAAGSDYSIVTLLTSPKFAVDALVESSTGTVPSGILAPTVGNQASLTLSYLPSTAQVAYGDEVVTSGFKDPKNALIVSNYPAGIPIGTVSNQNTQDSVLDDQQVKVHPSVDIQNLSVVQILTKPHAGH